MHPTRASFSCLYLTCSLSPPPPPPSPYPYASIYIQLPHTDTPFFRFHRKACANKVFSCDLNCDSVGTFLRVAGREFQRDGAMKLKERCPSDLRFHFIPADHPESHPFHCLSLFHCCFVASQRGLITPQICTLCFCPSVTLNLLCVWISPHL